jgi:hypothetical protein
MLRSLRAARQSLSGIDCEVDYVIGALTKYYQAFVIV